MLHDVVRSVLANDPLPDELVIVDQSDEVDQVMACLHGEGACTVRYLFPKTTGLSRANNLGAEEAAHEVLLFTHDDVLVERNWVSALTAAFHRGRPRAVVTGRVAATEPEEPGAFAPALRDDVTPASYSGRIGFDVLKPMNMAMAKTALLEVGGFDVRLGPGTPFPGAEDADLGLRFLEAGYRIDYIPEAVVHHRAWRSGADYLPLRWGYGVSHGAFYAKHFSWRDPHILGRMTRDVVRRACAFPGRVRRERSRALGDPVFVVGNVVGAARWWLRHRA